MKEKIFHIPADYRLHQIENNVAVYDKFIYHIGFPHISVEISTRLPAQAWVTRGTNDKIFINPEHCYNAKLSGPTCAILHELGHLSCNYHKRPRCLSHKGQIKAETLAYVRSLEIAVNNKNVPNQIAQDLVLSVYDAAGRADWRKFSGTLNFPEKDSRGPHYIAANNIINNSKLFNKCVTMSGADKFIRSGKRDPNIIII